MAQPSISSRNKKTVQQSTNAVPPSHRTAYRHKTPKRPLWSDIATQHDTPRECLAAYLALETAEVIAGIKPANLISIPNRTLPCGRNLYHYWNDLGRDVALSARLESYTMEDRGTSALVLFYRHDLLTELLAAPAVRALLRRSGYTGHSSLPELLGTLATRIRNKIFPHEIGILLGYPLKDVAGFMGLAKIPFTCQGPWRIYGDPGASLSLAATFRRCRRQMAEELTTCATPFDCLDASAQKHIFLHYN